MKGVIVRPMTPEDVAPVEKAAAADGHSILLPTHVIERHEQLIGAFSLGAVPLVHVWLDSHRAGALDSTIAFDQAEAVVRNYGTAMIGIPCMATSPFLPHMQRIAGSKGQEVVLFYKRI